MLVHFVGQQDRYQLGNTGKDQVSMEGLFVLCFPSGKTKRLFDMMDGAFYGCPYFIRGFPFRCSAQRAGHVPVQRERQQKGRGGSGTFFHLGDQCQEQCLCGGKCAVIYSLWIFCLSGFPVEKTSSVLRVSGGVYQPGD